MNNWTLVGNLTEDPKLFYSEKGTAICVFSIAAESGYGKYKKVTFPQIVTYGKTAEAHAKNLVKGNKVGVEGIGYVKKNTNKGKTYYNLQCQASNVEYLSKTISNRPDKEEKDYEPPALEDEDFEVPF